MKTRNGFVSNSSSSSFVAVGFLTTKELCDKYGFPPEWDSDYLIERFDNYGYVDIKDAPYIVCGLKIRELEYENPQELDMQKGIDNLVAKGIDKEDIHVYFGSLNC